MSVGPGFAMMASARSIRSAKRSALTYVAFGPGTQEHLAPIPAVQVYTVWITG